jgi:hypothetical protein
VSTARFADEDRLSNAVTLSQGQTSGTISRDFAHVPTKIWLSVQTPDSSVIWASLDGEPRINGFDFTLSAAPDADGFKLHYVCDF